MKKRILSMILALSMMLSLLPVSAFADTGGTASGTAPETPASDTQNSEPEAASTTVALDPDREIGVPVDNGIPNDGGEEGYWSYDSENKTLHLDCGTFHLSALSAPDAVLDASVSIEIGANATLIYASSAGKVTNRGTINQCTFSGEFHNEGGTILSSIVATDPGVDALRVNIPSVKIDYLTFDQGYYLVKDSDYMSFNQDLVGDYGIITGWQVEYVPADGGEAHTYTFPKDGNVSGYSISVSTDGLRMYCGLQNAVPAGTLNITILTPSYEFSDKELELDESGCPDVSGMTEQDGGIYAGKNWVYNVNPNLTVTTLYLKDGAKIDAGQKKVQCMLVVEEGASIESGIFDYSVVVKGGTINGGIFNSIDLESGTVNDGMARSLNNCAGSTVNGGVFRGVTFPDSLIKVQSPIPMQFSDGKGSVANWPEDPEPTSFFTAPGYTFTVTTEADQLLYLNGEKADTYAGATRIGSIAKR